MVGVAGGEGEKEVCANNHKDLFACECSVLRIIIDIHAFSLNLI